MSASAQLAFEDAKGGMNAADPPHRILSNQIARGVNISLVDGFPTTRPGVRVVPLSGDRASFVAEAAFQGSIFYNPAKGQGGIVLAEDNATLALASGGRKFLVGFEGRRTATVGKVKDITGPYEANGQLHLNWLSQWEDMLISTDGESKTFIFKPADGASLSKGYNLVEKLKSEIPNGATCPFYAHARGMAVILSRHIVVGDSLFRTSFTDSSNLKEFTEQVHWATGPYFLPPSSMGEITAVSVLVTQDGNDAQGDIAFHTTDGVFLLDINQYPRSKWSELRLVKHLVMQAGATGPYAVASRGGDQLYRSRLGAQSLRNAMRTMNREGAPERLLSPEVDCWLAGDYPRWLRFACVTVFGRMKKVFYTTYPVVRGSHRWHRGIVSRNIETNKTGQESPAAWEGLWTFPPQIRGIIQMVGGLFDGHERHFAWTRGSDKRNRLVEFSPILTTDVLEDGGLRQIRCQVQTRAVNAGQWWKTREFTDGSLFLRGIRGNVSWGVWFRPLESTKWIFWKAGTIEVLPPKELVEADPHAVRIPLGMMPRGCIEDSESKSNESRSVQFLIRWEGACQLEGLKINHGEKDLKDDNTKPELLNIVFRQEGVPNYDDFEFSATDAPTWITNQPI